MSTQHTAEGMTIEQAENVQLGDTVVGSKFGKVTVCNPRFPVMKKGSRVIQRSLLVRTEADEQRLLIIAEGRPPELAAL